MFSLQNTTSLYVARSEPSGSFNILTSSTFFKHIKENRVRERLKRKRPGGIQASAAFYFRKCESVSDFFGPSGNLGLRKKFHVNRVPKIDEDNLNV